MSVISAIKIAHWCHLGTSASAYFARVRVACSVVIFCKFLNGIRRLTTVLLHSSQTCCNFTGLLSLVISSDCNKSLIIRFVTTCHLQICYNLLKQHAPSLWITNFDNQLATSLLTTCNGFVVNKLSQAISMRTHYDTDSLTASLLQDVNIFVSVTQS